MEYPEDDSDKHEFKNHPFDKYRHIKKKEPKVISLLHPFAKGVWSRYKTIFPNR